MASLIRDVSVGILAAAILGVGAQELTRITRPGDNWVASTGEGSANSPRVALNGSTVVFSSASRLATNVAGAPTVQVYVRERQPAPKTRLASVSTNGWAGNADSYGAVISSDGRYIFFESLATDLVTNQLGGAANIYRHDLTLGQTTLVSVSTNGSNGAGGNGKSGNPMVSLDGLTVVFESAATSLTKTQHLANRNIYARNLNSGVTTLVSATVKSSGLSGSFDSRLAAISEDGNSVLFYSDALDLTATNLPSQGVDRLYLRDVRAGTIDFVSRSPRNANQYPVGAACMNKNGSVVAFVNSGLMVASTNGGTNVYYRVIPTGDLKEITLAREFLTNMARANLSMSPSGSRVAIALPGATPLTGAPVKPRLLLWDAMRNELAEINLTQTPPTGTEALTVVFQSDWNISVGPLTNSTPFPPNIPIFGGTLQLNPFPSGSFGANAEESIAAFEAERMNPLQFPFSNDRNGEMDVYVQGSGINGVELASGVAADGYVAGDFKIHTPGESQRNSEELVFTSASSRLVAGDTNGFADVFVWAKPAGPTRLVSSAEDDQLGNGPSYDPALAADGTFVAFVSAANNFMANDTNKTEDVFVKNLETDGVELLSLAATNRTALQPPGTTRGTVISRDGRYVAFTTMRDDLGANTRDREHIFVRDREAGATLWASRLLETNSTPKFHGKALAIFDSTLWLKSRTNVYRYNLTNDTIAFVGLSDPDPVFTPDGSIAVLRTRVAGRDLIYRYFATNGETNEVLSAQGALGVKRDSLSVGNLGQVAFVTEMKLSANDLDNRNDVYVATGIGTNLTLASARQLPNTTNLVEAPVLSGDGRRIFYRLATQPIVPRTVFPPPATNELYFSDLIGNQAQRMVRLTNGLPTMRALRLGEGAILASGELYYFSEPPPLDSDGDGMLDSLEMSAFGSLSETPQGDFDGDGMSNLLEIMAGTDPKDSSSVLSVTIQPANEGNFSTWRLSYDGLPGGTLTLQYSDDINSNRWSPVPYSVNLEGDGRFYQFDGDSGTTNRFYRLEVLP